MNIFMTGVTGFLGGELLMLLSKNKEVEKIYCLIRANDSYEASSRLNHVFELHGDIFDRDKIIPVIGNLIDNTLHRKLSEMERLSGVAVVIHAAANTSFSRMRDDLVQRTNIDGTNQILEWANELKGLKTFLYVGTASICGTNILNRLVLEDESPNINANHLVKYCNTKMVGEMNVRKRISEEKLLVVRPSIVMGDSRSWIPRSYVIMWALQALNVMRLLPVNPNANLDIVPVDYASRAIVELLFAARKYTTYHVSAGVDSVTNLGKLTSSIKGSSNGRPEFCFINRAFISQMKSWSAGRLVSGSEILKFNDHLRYWKDTFKGSGNLRILLSGLDAYLKFIELSQIFDNSRLLADTTMGNPEPAHEYMKRNKRYMEDIDVLEGAVDP